MPALLWLFGSAGPTVALTPENEPWFVFSRRTANPKHPLAEPNHQLSLVSEFVRCVDAWVDPVKGNIGSVTVLLTRISRSGALITLPAGDESHHCRGSVGAVIRDRHRITALSLVAWNRRRSASC